MHTTEQLSDINRTFVPPASLSESSPRDVRLTAAGRALFVVALMLFAGALVAFVALTRESNRQAANRTALVERGVTTTGVVTRLWTDGDDRRKVAYRFEAEGQSFNDDIKVSRARRRDLAVGSPLGVRYLPGNPRLNDLGGTPRSGLPRAIGPIVASVMVIVGAFCLVAIRVQRRLLAEGRVAPALVTSHKTQQSSHAKHHSMTYAFRLMSGATAAGKSGSSRKPPAVGSVITVIYDPDEPSRSRVYPFSLVAPS